MKILSIQPSFPISNEKSIASWALKQAEGLKAVGNELTVVSPSPWLPDYRILPESYERWSKLESEKNISGIDVKYPKIPTYNSNITNQLIYYPFPHIESIPIYLSVKNSVEKIDEFDAILCTHPVRSGYTGYKLQKLYNIPYFVVEQSHRIDYYQKHILGRNMYKKVVENADGAIAVSQMIRSRMQSLTPTVNIDIVRNGYDPFEVKNATARNNVGREDAVTILSVGSLIDRKGHKYTIRAVERIHNSYDKKLNLVILGGGENRKELEKTISENGLENIVKLKGEVSREEVNRYYSSSDIFILPSWNEPCATVYPEAMAHGLPVVMCEGEGFSELIDDRENGLLVEKQSTEDIVNALKYLIEHEDKREDMGEKGKEFVESNLTWQKIGERITKIIYENIDSDPS